MNGYTDSYDDGQIQPLTFSDDLYLDSEKFMSPNNLGLFGNEPSYKEIDMQDGNRLLSRKNSFSFDLDFYESSEKIANLSVKFESPKKSEPAQELNTAVTIRDNDPKQKKFTFTEMSTKESIGSFKDLPEKQKNSFDIQKTKTVQPQPHYIEIKSTDKVPTGSISGETYLFTPTKETLKMGVDSPIFELKKDKVKKLRKKRHDGCSCKNSNCLRLHCACFKELGYCKPTCKCADCLNKTEFNKTRNFAIEKTKFIFSNAFAPHDPIEVTDVNYKPQKINPRGCNCKSGCSRNYCDCRKVNGKCSYLCKCNVCNNDKVELSREEIIKIYKPSSRKKHKLVINYNKEGTPGRPNIIEFQTYQSSK